MRTGFGVEEEYLLTHLGTRKVVIEPTTGALSACREALGVHFSQEMFKSDGRFIDSSSLAPLSAREWLLQLQARFERADVHIDQAIRIFTTGSSADQQLKVYDQAVTRGLAHEFALREVVDLLINQTAQTAL